MKFEKNESILVLGGSRGLGRALYEQLKAAELSVFSLSRKSELSYDFSKPEVWDSVVSEICKRSPTRLIYCAGGGPYGPFQKFAWKDHQWTLRVNFEFPAYLTHRILQKPWPELKQICFIGSAVAESAADPGAASYCAAKHALKGFVSTLQKEQNPFDFRLLSPGYMKTALLPVNSAPRNSGVARDPADIARQMIHSITNAEQRGSHQSFD